MAESFFGSLKKQKIRKKVYWTREFAKADLFECQLMFFCTAARRSHLR